MTEEETNRRQDSRMAVHWDGTLLLADDSRFHCQVLDVSLAGVKIITQAQPAVGDEIMLCIPALGEFAGKVCWQNDTILGLELQAGPDLLLKRVAEDWEHYPNLMPAVSR